MKTKQKLEMEFVKTKVVKSYLGSMEHNYEVKNVINAETGEILAKKYVFGASKQFAVLGAEPGDKITMGAHVVEGENGEPKFMYFGEVRKVD
jgi:hypothetical protein